MPEKNKQLTRKDVMNIVQETLGIYEFPLRTKESPHFLQFFPVIAGGKKGQGILIGKKANLGIFFGSGAPTLSAAQGSLYLRTDGSSTSTRAYINTDGGTTWTSITTAA